MQSKRCSLFVPSLPPQSPPAVLPPMPPAVPSSPPPPSISPPPTTRPNHFKKIPLVSLGTVDFFNFVEDNLNDTNRLIVVHSPYLLQYTHNPANWYPWGDIQSLANFVLLQSFLRHVEINIKLYKVQEADRNSTCNGGGNIMFRAGDEQGREAWVVVEKEEGRGFRAIEIL